MPGLRRADVLAGIERARAANHAVAVRGVRPARPGSVAGRDVLACAVGLGMRGKTRTD